MLKVLLLAIVIASANASANASNTGYEEFGGTDAIGEASLEVMQSSGLISIASYMRKNKTMRAVDINTLCNINNKVDMMARETKILNIILKDNNMDSEVFKESGFVNADCGNINFVARSMHENVQVFNRWVEYGINMNRPIIYYGIVGTPLDIAFHMINKKDERLTHWRQIARILLVKKFKKCKELNLKCSIDTI